jgi:hypothetical protein
MNSFNLIHREDYSNKSSLLATGMQAPMIKLTQSQIQNLILGQCKLITDTRVVDFYSENKLE